MRKSSFSEEQSIGILKEAGVGVATLLRRYGISRAWPGSSSGLPKASRLNYPGFFRPGEQRRRAGLVAKMRTESRGRAGSPVFDNTGGLSLPFVSLVGMHLENCGGWRARIPNHSLRWALTATRRELTREQSGWGSARGRWSASFVKDFRPGRRLS